MVNSQLVEKHRTEQEEMRHCYEEKMRTLQEEKVKTSSNKLCLRILIFTLLSTAPLQLLISVLVNSCKSYK